MQTTNCLCNQCKKAIDPANGKISFVPVRGGLTLVVDNGRGNAGQLLNAQADFCDEVCLTEFVKAIGAQIKPAPAPAQAKAA